MVNENFKDILDDLTGIGQSAESKFGNLSAEQINWRPSEEGWSVGQCFEHLIIANEMLFDELDKIASGKRRNSLFQSLSPLSGFFGNFLITSLKKDDKKYKAPTRKIVPPSEIDPNIVEIFMAHQTELTGKIKATEKADWKKTKVTSPFLFIATYTLSDAYEIVVEHEKRHIRQAERVLQKANFPK